MSAILKCPGQDSRFWKPEDVCECECPSCGGKVEFFKDDRKRKCPHCGSWCANPRLDLGCLEWCKFADKCKKEGPAVSCESREKV
jgi:hypothetical protein